MPSRTFGRSLAAGVVAAVVVVGGGAVAIVGPQRLHEGLHGEHEGESLSAFAREHQGLNQHSQALATVMEKLKGGAEVATGPNQMNYENAAFPRSAIGAREVKTARLAFKRAEKRGALARSKDKGSNPIGLWRQLPNRQGTVPGAVTYTGVPSHVSGRTTSLVIAPDSRTVYVGTAGGGVWKTDNITAAKPAWRPISDSLPSQAIGSLTLAGDTLYVGTGEPNGSSDSEAGVGLFKSTDGGATYTEVSGFHNYAKDRSVASIAVEPGNSQHLLIGTALARHGSSSVNGGRMTPPGAAPLGLYESTDGGSTWTQRINEPQDPVIGSTANGADFFRGGVTQISFDPNNSAVSYAAVNDYGLYRSAGAGQPYSRIYTIGTPGAPATSATSRLAFAVNNLEGKTRIYLGDATRFLDSTNVYRAGLLRTDDAAAAAPSWQDLSNPDPATTGFDSYNFCQAQCSYDMAVSSPLGQPNTVLLSGSMNYGEIFYANLNASNGRAIIRSTNGGVSFTDMTNDVANNGLHPDQHALAFLPNNPNAWVLGDDGGVAVESGPFVDRSADCASRGLNPVDLANCRRWLSAIPTSNREVNSGLQTLQFQSMSVHEDVIQGGTQDNGTWESDMPGGPSESVGGDGGNSYIDPANSDIRIHSYYNPQLDVNFQGSKPTGWDWIADPLLGSGEASSFYVPVEGDRTNPGTVYVGLQHIWRTTDNGGRRSYLQQHCNEFTGDFADGTTCGDWRPMGGDLSSTAYGADNAGPSNYVVAISHAQRKTNVLWAATRRGRLFISTNANAANPSSVTYKRLDLTAQGGPLPTRFISGISLDPRNPYHAVVSYSGYSAYAAGGHVYDVTYDPATGTIKATDISGNLGDQPVTAIAMDWRTGSMYAATDFGVLMLAQGSPGWMTTPGLPPVAVYGLTLDQYSKRLYAATHGRGWYVNRIS